MNGRKDGAADFHSRRDQETKIKAAADARGFDVELLDAELDVSGASVLAKRPSLSKAIAGVEAGRYAGIAVAFQSRLARDVRLEEEMFERVEAVGGEILFADDPADNVSADGRMVRRIKASIHAKISDAAREDFDARTRESVALGIWQRRVVPTGYLKDAETRRLVTGPRAGEVHQAFTDRANGRPIVHVARDLQMTPNGTRHLLSNRVYLGEIRVGDHVNAEAHEAIVSPELFDRVQRAVQTRRTRPEGSRAPALLEGLVICQGCGHRMSRRNNRSVIYGCAQHHSAGRCPNPATIVLATLDAYVEGLIRGVNDQATNERFGRRENRAETLDAARQAVEAARAAKARALRILLAADSDEADAAVELRELDAAIAAAVAREDRILASTPADGGYITGDKTIETPEHLAIAIREIVGAVIVSAAGRGKRVATADRVVVVHALAELDLPRRQGGTAIPVVAVDLDRFNGDDLIGESSLHHGEAGPAH